MSWDGGFDGMFPISTRGEKRKTRFEAKGRRKKIRRISNSRSLKIDTGFTTQEQLVRIQAGVVSRDVDAYIEHWVS